MTLRPIAYGTGLTLSTDGKLRIVPRKHESDWEIAIEENQGRGVVRWSIRRVGDNCCLNRDGRWEYEPQPSSRDDAFFARCRFASLDDAVEFLRKEAERGRD